MNDPLRQTTMTTSISDQTRALLLTGRTVCARAPSRANGIVTWAGVESAQYLITDAEADANNPPLRVFSFGVSLRSLDAGRDSIRNLFDKRAVTVQAKSQLDETLRGAVEVLESWGVDPTGMRQAELDQSYPLWLSSILLRTARFENRKTTTGDAITDLAYALLFLGQELCVEMPPSDDRLRAWVTVDPDRGFKASGSPRFRVFSFEVPASSIEAGYDIAGEMSNERETWVSSEKGFDEAATAIADQLTSRGADPSRLIRVAEDTDYPL
jgi:hypothetical protein